MTNGEIAEAFTKIASILQLFEENPFRIRAYDRAAEIVAGLNESVSTIYQRGGIKELKGIKGIGDDLASKIGEMTDTGHLEYLQELEKKVPAGLFELLRINGLGPKKTSYLWKNEKVTDIASLKKVLESGKLLTVKGWGEKSVEKILKGITTHQSFGTRVSIAVALPIAEQFAEALRGSKLCQHVEIAGSMRRRKETVGDIDILVVTKHPEKVTKFFVGYPQVTQILAEGETRSSVLLGHGLQADLRVVDENVFGAALHYFTGSKDHNVAIRKMGIAKGLTISEYGVYKGTAEKKGALVAAKTEKDVYKAVGLPFIPPELREGGGEIEAAQAGKLPDLVTEEDLKGDLHLHSTFSDGVGTMVEMAKAAKEQGFEYIAVTDHGSGMGMVKGIKTTNIDEYLKLVAEARKKVPGIHILSGTEVDIQPDGSLYLPDSVLKKLDWVVASIHGKFDLDSDAMTKRLLRAIENPYVCAIGHPTARKINERKGIDADWDKVFAAAAKRKVLLEVSASPDRLDLNDVLARSAIRHGAILMICSDAHHPKELRYRYGIDQARRGWVEAKNIANTWAWAKFEKWLRDK